MTPNVYNGMKTCDGVIVTCNGRILDAGPSLRVRPHSPDGFNWGYMGSGPAQLALAILMHELPVYVAQALYQDFKADVVSKLPRDYFILHQKEIQDWLVHQSDGKQRAERDACDLGIEIELIAEDEPIKGQAPDVAPRGDQPL